MINKTQNIHRKMCSSKSNILLLHLEMNVKEGMKNNLQFIIYLDQCQAFCSLLLRPKAKCRQSLLVILPYTILLRGASKKRTVQKMKLAFSGVMIGRLDQIKHEIYILIVTIQFSILINWCWVYFPACSFFFHYGIWQVFIFLEIFFGNFP